MCPELPTRIAIKALQRMFLAFTGRELPEAEAIRLIEQTRTDDK